MITGQIGRIMVALATLAHLVVAPAQSMSQEIRDAEDKAILSIFDVRLDDQGRLHVSLCRADGSACPHRNIEIREVRGETVQTATDAQGDATVTLARGGVFLIVAGETGKLCRVWTQDAAPPAAVDGVLLVEDATIIRGYRGPGKGVYNFLRRNPLMTLGIGAAAVAIPVALWDKDDAS
jgi:hypothetical protein